MLAMVFEVLGFELGNLCFRCFVEFEVLNYCFKIDWIVFVSGFELLGSLLVELGLWKSFWKF